MSAELFLKQVRSVIGYETDSIARMANVAAMIHEEFGFWWTGFYRVIGNELVLGPFQGPMACMHIPFGKGVCGTAWKERRPIIVPNVEKFPGHIACSSLSRSEIVVPVWQRGQIVGVLDIDSKELDTFKPWHDSLFQEICAILACPVNPSLENYVETEILPLHDKFDAGHRRDHVRSVIASALKMAVYYDVDPDMVFAAAAFHDTGLSDGRELHHEASARIIRDNAFLKSLFSEQQIDTIAWAAYDHRASSGQEPRSIYGKIVAEADRQISAESVMLRTVQYGLKNYPQLDKEGHWRRAVDHMHEKYDYGGYLKLWIPESDNAVELERLRHIIANDSQLRQLFEQAWQQAVTQSE